MIAQHFSPGAVDTHVLQRAGLSSEQEAKVTSVKLYLSHTRLHAEIRSIFSRWLADVGSNNYIFAYR